MKPTEDRPTPETDALWQLLNTGNRQPSWWEVAERLCEHACELEAQRDEAREALRELWQSADAYIPSLDQNAVERWRKIAGLEAAK